MRVVLAGGSGALGRRIAADLAPRGHEIVVLTRQPPSPASPYRQLEWDGEHLRDWADEVDGAVVVNLAGALVDRPPAPPIPKPFLRLGAMLLRTDPPLALTGRRCIPARLLEAGFPFTFPELGPALEDLVDPR